MTKVKIKKGDSVIITTGKDKGGKGEVLEVIKKEGKDPRVLVAGINIVKKHMKPSAQSPQGTIVEREASIHISNVALIDPKSKKATRVGYKMEGEKKVRFSKKSGETI